MSDTPETDYNCGFYDLELAVPAEFARELERQRNELLSALDQITKVTSDSPVKVYQQMENIARAAIAKAKEAA